MSCPPVTTLEDAMKKLPSSVVPIQGLRRDNEGNLTQDALRTIVDGLKSRGIDPSDPTVHDTLQGDLGNFLCSLNSQYNFLLNHLFRMEISKQEVSDQFIETLKDRNITMQDVINVSRHLDGIRPSDSTSTFIEGWQNTQSVPAGKANKDSFFTMLKEDFTTLSGDTSYLEIKKRKLDLSSEKNAVAHNYLGLYGFLNLTAIGLMIYIAAGQVGRKT